MEDGPIVPQGRYGLSKHLVEQMAPHYAQRLDIRIARPFSHLGSHQRPELVIPSLLRRLTAAKDETRAVRMQGIDSVRDFIDVRDVATAYLANLEMAAGEHRTFNVCTGTGNSIGDLARLALRLLGSAREIEFEGKPNSKDDIPYLVGSPERLKAETAWKPELSLEQSLVTMLQTMQRQGEP